MEYNHDIKIQKRNFWKRILRYLIFNVILIIVGFSRGLFSNQSTTVVGLFLLLIFNVYGFIILNNRFKIIFKSISVATDTFHLKYLLYSKNNELRFKHVTAEAKINFTHYSTKTTLPIKVKLITENGEISFYFLLKEVILLFHFLEKNGGIVKKDFEFKMTLKELKTNKEYEDVYSEIDDLLK